MAKYVIEFIGTFFLVLVAGLTGNPLAIGGVLAVMVYLGGYISGANYNPAVSLALWIQKKLSSKDFLVYAAVQLVAGLAAAAAVGFLGDTDMVVAPGDGVSFWTAFAAEAIFTFALVFTVLNVAFSKKTKDNHYFGLAIGAVVMAGAFAVGKISGGAFNPAVGIGPDLLNWDLVKDWSTIWLYLFGPLVGGAVASLIWGWSQKNLK